MKTEKTGRERERGREKGEGESEANCFNVCENKLEGSKMNDCA